MSILYVRTCSTVSCTILYSVYERVIAYIGGEKTLRKYHMHIWLALAFDGFQAECLCWRRRAGAMLYAYTCVSLRVKQLWLYKRTRTRCIDEVIWKKLSICATSSRLVVQVCFFAFSHKSKVEIFFARSRHAFGIDRCVIWIKSEVQFVVLRDQVNSRSNARKTAVCASPILTGPSIHFANLRSFCAAAHAIDVKRVWLPYVFCLTLQGASNCV